jgi:chromosomal replication initiation ATPase DnaA
MGMENQNNLIMQPCATLDCENLVPMPGSDFARFFPTMKILCESCDIERIEELKRKQAKEEQERRQEAFFSLCPPIYRESDLNRIPAAFLRECRTWKVSPQGLAFVGKAGSGKTRASWLLLKRLHFSGVGVYGLTATQYAKACADQWQDNAQLKATAEEVLEKCRKVRVLLIDDLGKNKFTERAELEFFDLLEHRTSHEMPVIWTANAEGTTFLKMLSSDRGEPILRRLSEFTKIIDTEHDR